MFDILQMLTVLLVVVAMALSLAHALELPGKMRLTREIYFAMQKTLTPDTKPVEGKLYLLRQPSLWT
jgi:hypothetical protein